MTNYVGNSTPLQRVVSALGLDFLTGFMRTEYGDILPSSTWEVPLGATAPDTVSVTIAGLPLRMKSFGSTGTETQSNSFGVLHWVDVGQLNTGALKLEVHVHGRPSTTGAGAVVMQVAMIHSPGNAGAPTALSTARCVFNIPASHQYYHMIAGAEFNAPAGGYNIGDKISFNLFRDPTDAGDTYDANFLFEQCGLHAPDNSRGSRTRYTK